jgi:molybdenum cofactor guanylyltransferase
MLLSAQLQYDLPHSTEHELDRHVNHNVIHPAHDSMPQSDQHPASLTGAYTDAKATTNASSTIIAHNAPITAIVLAGGQGSRMGGLDKGLQLFHGTPLVQHAVQRLRQQSGGLVGGIIVNANRHFAQYAQLGVPVRSDDFLAMDGVQTPGDIEATNTVQANPPSYDGPLAGFACGLRHCPTDWLLTVPCDTPLFPLDLAERLWHAAQEAQAPIAVAYAPEPDVENHAQGHPELRAQPVFCLLHTGLADSLGQYLHSGGRKINTWLQQHACAQVAFTQAHDDPSAFANVNTANELQALQNKSKKLSTEAIK